MRVGFNPNKNKKIDESDFYHQVIIPVHIPNFEGYFKDSFQIFKYCIESLFKTSHSKTYYTIINNGSCNEVSEYLNDLYNHNKIHELMHTTSIGKLNSILKGMSGHSFSLVTISDADVLFLNDWQKGTYDVFEAFPKAGAVCPTPSSKVLKQFTANIIIDNILSRNMKFTEVKNTKALSMFASSIGNCDFYKEVHLNKNLTITSKKGTVAVVGAGHFIATYRREVYIKPELLYSKFKMGSALKDFLDKPVLKNDYWRLSTNDNYAYHMGNVIEGWMSETIETLKICNEEYLLNVNLHQVSRSKLKARCQSFIFDKLLTKKIIWKRFLQWKGLTPQEAKHY